MAAAKSATENILVVDDDPVHVKLLDNILREHQYGVVTVAEAAQGLQIAMDKMPQLIILDVMMPVINGYNFCHILKTQEKYKHIPIIILTSRDEQEDREIGERAGADAYLTKPLNIHELLETIKRLLNK